MPIKINFKKLICIDKIITDRFYHLCQCFLGWAHPRFPYFEIFTDVIPLILNLKVDKNVFWDSQVAQWLKNPLVNAEDASSISVSGRFPGRGNGNPLQYPCLENCMDRGAWWATFHGVTKSWTWLSVRTDTHIPQNLAISLSVYLREENKHAN